MKRPNLPFTSPAWKAGMLVMLFSLLLAACAPSGAAAQGPYGNAAATPTGSAPTALVPVTGGDAVQVANNPRFGQILVTSTGMTLYTFAIDQVGVSRCESQSCVAFWPPYVASAQPTAAAGIVEKLGLLTRSDGRMQITYNEMPLYTFIADKNPGDVQGDGVNQFGGVWHVVVVGGSTGGAGSAATPAPPAAATAPATGGTAIQVATNPKLGQILVTASGMTLYTFSLDTKGVSNCPDVTCTGYWPPYTVNGALTGAAEIQSQLSAITRSNGTQQAAYNGLPLYTYVGDINPGDVQGDGVTDSGGTWHVVVVGGSS